MTLIWKTIQNLDRSASDGADHKFDVLAAAKEAMR